MVMTDEISTASQAANVARRHRDDMVARFAETGDPKFLSSAIVAQDGVRAAGRRMADEALASCATRRDA